MKYKDLTANPEAAHYQCRRVASPISIDGDLNKPVWQESEKSPRFADMVTGQPGFYDTREAW